MTEANVRKLRNKLMDRISRAKADRQQQRLLVKNDGNLCEHEWKTYKQIIRIDHSVEVLKNQPRNYSGPVAPYFVVRACPKCKTKRYLDMLSD